MRVQMSQAVLPYNNKNCLQKMPKYSSFLKKLMLILSDSSVKEIISWGKDGCTFQIHRVGEFVETVLPAHFKHGNMSSFVRQLNMYGFNRARNSEQNAYFHPNFKKGHTNALRFIKRKKKQSGLNFMESDSNQDSDQFSLESATVKTEWQIKCERLKKMNEELRSKNQTLSKRLEEINKNSSNFSRSEEEKGSNDKNIGRTISSDRPMESLELRNEEFKTGRQAFSTVLILQGSNYKRLKNF